MSVSQTTTFLLKNGKEELEVSWDVSNEEIVIERREICPDIDLKRKKKKTKNTIRIRNSDLGVAESEELLMTLHKALGVIFNYQTIEEYELEMLNKEEDRFDDED